MQQTIKIDKLTCIDDSHRPNEISINHWIKSGEQYTPIGLKVNSLTGDKMFLLKEVHPDNPAYGGYNINRFGVVIENIEEFIETNELILEEV